jgi:hypothetical protein
MFQDPQSLGAKITSLQMAATVDFYRMSANQAQLSIQPSGGIQPYVVVSQTDVTGRADGVGNFNRTFPAGEQVTLTAEPVVGNAKFQYWANASGGVIGASASLSLTLTSATSVHPVYAGSSVTSTAAHFAVGGSYTTGFFVINTGANTANFALTFRDDSGNPVALPVAGAGSVSTLSGSVAAGGMQYYEASNPSGPTLGGSVSIAADPSVTVHAIFRNHAIDGNYYEAAVPATSGSSEFLVPFDVTTFSGTGASFFTGLAIANTDAATAANITCTARDTNGNVIPNAVNPPPLPPGGHWAGYQFPALVGMRGTLDCSSNTVIAATGLRFLGYSAFSSLPVILK